MYQLSISPAASLHYQYFAPISHQLYTHLSTISITVKSNQLKYKTP